MLRNSILSYFGIVIILSIGLCLNLPSVCLFMLQPYLFEPVPIQWVHLSLNYHVSISWCWFIAKLKVSILIFFISACNDFHSSMFVRGTEMVLGVEAQNREPKLLWNSCEGCTTCVLELQLHIRWYFNISHMKTYK